MTMKTLRRGDDGQTVITAQVRLTALGYPLSCDGIFGKNTLIAATAFQVDSDLVPDGIIGPKTWAALLPPEDSLIARLPDYLQGQSPWGKTRYGSGTYAASACGPTAMAMAASALLDREITPPDAGAWSVAHGYRTPNQGTDWGFFEAYGRALGIGCEMLYASKSDKRGRKPTGHAPAVKVALDTGKKLVIARMGPGRWTKAGHFILLYAMDGDDALIRDPAMRIKPERLRAPLAYLDTEGGPYFILEKEA